MDFLDLALGIGVLLLSAALSLGWVIRCMSKQALDQATARALESGNAWAPVLQAALPMLPMAFKFLGKGKKAAADKEE